MQKTKNKTCWVLTREHNAHDQYGEYFVAVFQHKPGLKQLASALKNSGETPKNMMEAIEFLSLLEEGGGRRGVEDVWFNLDEVEML